MTPLSLCVLFLSCLLCVSVSVSGQSSWTKVFSPDPSTPGPNNGALSSRFYSAAVAVHDAGVENLVVIQGLADDLGNVLPTISASKDGGASWFNLPQAAPFTRYAHVAVADTTGVNSYVVTVLGGIDSNGVTHGDVWRSTNLVASTGSSWTIATGSFSSRYHFGAAVYNGGQSILVFGGVDGSTGQVLADTYFSNNGGASFTHRNYGASGINGPWAARAGMAYATAGVSQAPTIVMIGGSTDALGSTFVGDVWFTSNDGLTWSPVAQSASVVLARGWASAVFSQSAQMIMVAGGRMANNVLSTDVFGASNSNFIFEQSTLVGNTFTARFGHSIVATQMAAGSTAENVVYSIGGRVSSGQATNDVFTFNPIAPAEPATTYAYEFVKYLPFCFSDLAYTINCQSGAPKQQTGYAKPQYKCTAKTGTEEVTFLQPNTDGTVNTADLCRAQSNPPVKAGASPLPAQSRCTLDSCYTLVSTSASSGFCSVGAFSTGCSNAVGYGHSDYSKTFTKQFDCRNKAGVPQFDVQTNKAVIGYPFKVVATGGTISYTINPASFCVGQAIPSGSVDTAISCTVPSCTKTNPAASAYSIQPAPLAQQDMTATNCKIDVDGHSRCSTPMSGTGGFYSLLFVCTENTPASGVAAITKQLNAPECAGQAVPNQAQYNTAAYACNQLIPCTDFYWASVGYGQCTRATVATPQYCYTKVDASTPVPQAYQYGVYQCFQGGTAVDRSFCASVTPAEPQGVAREKVACTLLPCIAQAAYLPIGIGQCVNSDNQATCCQRDAMLPAVPKPGFVVTHQPLCSTLAGKMHAATLYQCTYNGEGYPGQCIAPYPSVNTQGSSYFQTCMLPSCGIQGDPEFVGFRGQRYEIHGIPGSIFAIVSSPAVQYNAEFVFLGAKSDRECDATRTHPWTHPGTYLGQLGFMIGDERVLIVPGDCVDGITSVTVNGKAISIGDVHHFDGPNNQVLSYTDAHTLHIALTELDLTLENSDHFFNQQVSLTPAGQRTHRMHGLLGQTWSTKTYRDEAGQKHYIEGHPNDYLIQDDDIFGTDFIFNMFGN